MTTTDDDGRGPAGGGQSFVRITKPPQKTTWPWLLLAMAVVMAISVVSGVDDYWGHGDLSRQLAFGLGKSLLPGIFLGVFAYLVLYGLVLRTANRNNGSIYLVVLILTAIGSGMMMSAIMGAA